MSQLIPDIKCPRCDGLVTYKDVKDVVNNMNRRTYYCEDSGKHCGMIGLFVSKTRDEAEDLLAETILDHIKEWVDKNIFEIREGEGTIDFLNRIQAAQSSQ